MSEIIVVTGASAGLGRAIVEACDHGFSRIIVERVDARRFDDRVKAGSTQLGLAKHKSALLLAGALMVGGILGILGMLGSSRRDRSGSVD